MNESLSAGHPHMPETSIVIAAYNEEHRLPETLRRLQAYQKSQGGALEIIVVDDGSTDNTSLWALVLSLEVAGLRVIRYPRNRGKGFALRTGVLCSRGRMVLITDADLSTPIEELETLRPHLASRTHQIAIGSRALVLSQILEAQPPWRRGMGRIFNRIVSELVLDGFSDTQCGFKLFTREAARTLFAEARVERFAYDVEILALARRQGYRVAEVPIRWADRSGSRVRPLLDSLQMLVDLVRIRFRCGTPRSPMQQRP